MVNPPSGLQAGKHSVLIRGRHNTALQPSEPEAERQRGKQTPVRARIQDFKNLQWPVVAES